MRASSPILMLDTASEYVYLALLNRRGDVLEDVYRQGKNDHSVTLMPAMAEMLVKHGVKPTDLSRIIVGIGPGSYTGVRAGVTVAKMLAWSLSIPLSTVSSLALIASGAPEGAVLVWHDARNNNGFYGLFNVRKGQLIRLSTDAFGSMDEARNTMRYQRDTTHGKPNPAVLFASEEINAVDNVHTVAPAYLRQTEAERTKE